MLFDADFSRREAVDDLALCNVAEVFQVLGGDVERVSRRGRAFGNVPGVVPDAFHVALEIERVAETEAVFEILPEAVPGIPRAGVGHAVVDRRCFAAEGYRLVVLAPFENFVLKVGKSARPVGAEYRVDDLRDDLAEREKPADDVTEQIFDAIAEAVKTAIAYIQEEFNPSEKFVVKKNPNYRIKGLPKLDGITFIPVPENSTRAAMIRTGEADFITTVPLEQIKSLEADETLNVTAIPSIMQKHLDLNNFFKPFSDKRVRQAINYAINKDALVKVAYNGYAVPQYGILASQYPGAVKLGPWPYNPQKARELLKEAGYPNGFSTILWSGYNDTTSGKVVQFLQQQLAQVGIKVETKLLEPGVRTELILHVKGAADSKSRLFYIGWSDGSFDPDQVLRPILHSTQQPPVYMNTTYYANKHFDELIDKALVEPNEAKRNQLYEDAQKTAWEDAPWAFLLFEMSTGASNKHLKNFNMMVDQSFEFYNAEWVE